jgi:predicted Fe-Mo cluster-binding NifX family protein
MKLAIPVFGTRIAPRLDHAQYLLFLTVENGKVVGKQPKQTPSWTTAERLQLMKSQGIDVVICGGVDLQSQHLLRASGMELYFWITGEVDDAIASFLKGDLEAGKMLDKQAGQRQHERDRHRRAGHSAQQDQI